MSSELGLRERKKLRTRWRLSEVALRLFAEKGLDAATVEEICKEAEVSTSTFFRYFPSKEAAAFPEDHPAGGSRLEVIRQALEQRPPGEPPVGTARRAALALVDYDLARRDMLVSRAKLVAGEPALGAKRREIQEQPTEVWTQAIAEQLGVDEQRDLRPRLFASSCLAAVDAAYGAWLAEGAQADLRSLVNHAFDVLDEGFARAGGS
jgi:AcrR family transcriptional regulator